MRLLLASTNRGKLHELTHILSTQAVGFSLDLIATSDLDQVDETGANFVENALIKARHYSAKTGMTVVADDSGLEVDALQGRPGLHSARYAGADATDADRIAKLLGELQSVPSLGRGARFVCAAAIVWPEGEMTFTGEVRGTILSEARGRRGFGFDPVFYFEALGKTFAELTPEEKSLVSHRGIAFRRLGEWLMRSDALLGRSVPA